MVTDFGQASFLQEVALPAPPTRQPTPPVAVPHRLPMNAALLVTTEIPN